MSHPIAIVTDVQYRMAPALIRTLAEAGIRVYTCSYCGKGAPIGSKSKYSFAFQSLSPGFNELYGFVRQIGIKEGCTPALLPVGAETLQLIAENREAFAQICGLCIPSAEQLALLNSKTAVSELAKVCGVETPRVFPFKAFKEGDNLHNLPLPCVIKPVCGERLGLHAKDRYIIARTPQEVQSAFHHYLSLSPDTEPPIIQEYLPSYGFGCSVLAQNGTVLSAICHKRIREYPASGGPSSCCETIHDDALLAAVTLLVHKIRLTGLAMFEFKADADGKKYLLECNPRIWGSFPLLRTARSPIPLMWFASAWNPVNPHNTVSVPPSLPKNGVRMSFFPSDFAAGLSYIPGNYPDTPGAEGSAAWGGTAYDHYPDFGKDTEGGALHAPELVERLIRGGHEITNHTWSHVLWGKKNIIYGKRRHMNSLDDVVSNLKRLDRELSERWNYTVSLSRPPHYVDKIKGGFDSYDAYACMNYQYMAASFDGAGWLPLSSYEEEVRATWQPMEHALHADPDFFCGQIIFQKDGYNMARRSPVADGLEHQLKLLTDLGYRIVPVSELLAHAPFADVLPDSEVGKAASKLLALGMCPAFRDNTVRPDTVLTRGALAAIVFGWEGARRRIVLMREKRAPFPDVPAAHPYSGTILLAAEILGAAENARFRPDSPAGADDIRMILSHKTGRDLSGLRLPQGPYSHGFFLRLAADRLS